MSDARALATEITDAEIFKDQTSTAMKMFSSVSHSPQASRTRVLGQESFADKHVVYKMQRCGTMHNWLNSASALFLQVRFALPCLQPTVLIPSPSSSTRVSLWIQQDPVTFHIFEYHETIQKHAVVRMLHCEGPDAPFGWSDTSGENS